jgi:uncharacterized membrane protein
LEGPNGVLCTHAKSWGRFTEFYVLGAGGKIGDYLTNLTLGESGTVTLGVVNREYEEVNYTIVIKLDNETVGTINRR